MQEDESVVAADSPSRPPGRRPTIIDVAREADVSPAAVSKVLRDAYGVSPRMKDRVGRAVAELGYRPMVSARGMRSATQTLGVSSLNPGNPFIPLLLEGIADETDGTGYSTLIVLTGADGNRQLEAARSMLDRQMDGLILITPTMTEAELDELAANKPIVLLGRHGEGPGHDSVASDDTRGAELVVDHLVGRGHRRIAFHAQALRSTGLPDEYRLNGYLAAMERHGLRADVVEGEWSEAGGARLAEDLLAREEPPTAVHAGADMAALGALEWLWEQGLRAPGDLAVAGCDDVPSASLLPIGLTSVDQQATAMGRAAARLLIERLAGRTEPRHIVVEPQLRVRTST